MKKGLFLFLAIASMFLLAGNAFAVGVQWNSPPEGTSYPVGTIVNPTGQASGTEVGGSGLDLALVIDESGSMIGSKIAIAKEAAIALVNALPEDSSSVAVIGFDSVSTTYRLLTALNPDKQSVINAISSIAAGGSTNIGAGVAAGASALIGPGSTAGRSKMMVVLSDGVGSYNHEAATAYNNYGIITHTVGVPGHNVAQMQLIAAEGHGVYTNVMDMSQLVSIFNGTGGNLVGIDRVEITLPDGTTFNAAIDGLGNFTLPDWVMQLGVNTFTATAYDLAGSFATAQLNLNGVGTAPVPEPATMLLLGSGLMGMGVIRRKFKK